MQILSDNSGLRSGTNIEELKERVKELRRLQPHRKNSSANYPGPLKSPRDQAKNQRAYMVRFMAQRTYVTESCLVWPQWERMCLFPCKFDISGKRDAGGGEAGLGGQVGKHPFREGGNGVKN